MNREEFRDYWRDLRNRFPDSAKWLTHDRSEEDQRGILATWFEVLGGCDVGDCLEANRAIQAGESEWPKHFEQFPASVKRFAARRREERTRQTRTPEFEDLPKRKPTNGFGRMVAEIFTAKENGATEAEIKAMIDAKFPTVAETGDLDGRRYRCGLCLDSGLRSVVAARLLKWVKSQGTISGFTHERTEAVRCECEAGHRSDEKRCGILRYRVGDFLPWPKRSLTDDELTAEIRMFIDENSKPREARGVPMMF